MNIQIKPLGAFIFIIIAIGLFFGGYYYSQYYQKVPSQCYTNLKPSSFFVGKPLSTTAQGEVIISSNNKEIFTIQTSDSGSMLPSVPDWAVIVYIKPTEDTLRVGDIIYIKKANLLHRLVRIDGEEYITKGDNNAIEDKEKWRFKDIEGQVVGILY